jgi:hypothetical protein
MLAAGVRAMRRFDKSIEVGAALSLADFYVRRAGQFAGTRMERPSPIS